MTVGGVISRAFSAVAAAPLIFFGTSFVLSALPAAVLGIVMRTSLLVPIAARTAPAAAVWPILLVTVLGWWLLYLAAQAILIRATVAELDGHGEAIGHYATAALRSILPLLALSILLTLAVWFGMLLFFVPGVMLAIIWSVAAPAMVAERTGIVAAFGRSRRLTKGARWRIFGLCVLVFAVYWVAAATAGIGNVAMNGLQPGGVPSIQATPSIASSIVSAVLQTAFVTLWTAIQTTLYVELRDWKDGPAGDRLADIFA